MPRIARSPIETVAHDVFLLHLLQPPNRMNPQDFFLNKREPAGALDSARLSRSVRFRKHLVLVGAFATMASLVGAGCGGAGELDSRATIPACEGTVLGCDVDGNGVRDDVDRSIATRFPSSASGSRSVLTQLARTHQSFLRDGENAAALRADATTLDHAIACVDVVQGLAARGDVAWERSQVFNTPERVSAYARAQRSFVGLILFAPTDTSIPSCTSTR